MGNQKPRTIEEQIKLLRLRGMRFSSEKYAKECLSHISYFRLKYYWTDMIDEETEHDFLEDASFDDVIARYTFDRSLRLILFDAIEIIEVALRAKIINHLSQAKDSGLWYLDESLFEKMEYYKDFLLDLGDKMRHVGENLLHEGQPTRDGHLALHHAIESCLRTLRKRATPSEACIIL